MSQTVSRCISPTQTVELFPKKPSKKKKGSSSIRESNNPEQIVPGLEWKSGIKKVFKYTQLRVPKMKASNRLYSPYQAHLESLEDALKDKALQADQLIKKRLLETMVSIPDKSGQKMLLSKYLHERGFSYTSQASLVSVKVVNVYIINYLVALFFELKEYPLIMENLNMLCIKRISNKWNSLKCILNEITPSISTEDAVLMLLKNNGCAYESLSIFLNLFEKVVDQDSIRYEDLIHPFEKDFFVKSILEVSKGGHSSLGAFLSLFIKSKERSEWDLLWGCFLRELVAVTKEESSLVNYTISYGYSKWVVTEDNCQDSLIRKLSLKSIENPDRKEVIGIDEKGEVFFLTENMSCFRVEKGSFSVCEPQLTEGLILNHLITCLKKNGGVKNKQAFVDCFIKPELLLNGKTVSLYRFLRSELDCDCRDTVALQLLARCVSNGGGSKNKEALVDCFSSLKFDFDGKKVSFYHLLQLKKGEGLSSSESIQVIMKCIANTGGSRNLKAFEECLTKPEINHCGVRVSVCQFLVDTCSLSVSQALNIILKCIAHDGGSLNKKTFLMCLMDPKINLSGRGVSLYDFLSSEQGCNFSPFDTIQIIVKCVGNDGGSLSGKALMSCFSDKEIVLDSRMTFYEFLRSEKAGNVSVLDAIRVIVSCIGHNGGSKNKVALVECFTKKEIEFNGMLVSFYTLLISKHRGNLSESEAIQIIVSGVGHNGGSKNKQALIDCFIKPEMNLGGKWSTVYEFLKSVLGESGSDSEIIQYLARTISHPGGSKNKQALIECLTNPEVELGGKKIPIFQFLCSDQGGGMSASDALKIIVKCISNAGGLKNKHALMECLGSDEIIWDGKKLSIYNFLRSDLGGRYSVKNAIQMISKCLCFYGGMLNKQALKECLNNEEEDLGGTVYQFLRRDCLLNAFDTMQILFRCISSVGGANNKQALIACFSAKEFKFCGRKVPFWNFLTAHEFSSYDALQFIVKCLGQEDGAKSYHALIGCFNSLEVNLDGQKVSIFDFLSSEKGGCLGNLEAIEVIMACVSHYGGSRNIRGLIECFVREVVDLDGRKISIFDFLSLERGLSLGALKAIEVIATCASHKGGARNIQGLIDCFVREEIDLGYKKVPLFKYFLLGGRLSSLDAVELIVSCIGRRGGLKNKCALVDCFNKPEVFLHGKKISLYKFLQSKKGGECSASRAMWAISKCFSNEWGSSNKDALIECLNKLDVYVDGKKETFYEFLQSPEGVGLSAFNAIRVLIECISYPRSDGLKNKQAFMACFCIKKGEDQEGHDFLFNTLLSLSLTYQESTNLCVVFSVYQDILNPMDILKVFKFFKEGDRGGGLINLFNHYKISCYDTLLNVIAKVILCTNSSLETKRRYFWASCQSLVGVFFNEDSFFVRKRREHPDWNATSLAEKCIDACALYAGKDINEELQEREDLICNWIQPFSKGYQLTQKSLDIMTHVQSVDVLRNLIELSKKEIMKRSVVDPNFYENSLGEGFEILLESSHSTLHTLLKYADTLFEWFDMKTLRCCMRFWRGAEAEEAIHYFFENQSEIVDIWLGVDSKRSFIIYMALSAITPKSKLPLLVNHMMAFLEIVHGKYVDLFSEKYVDDLCLFYAIFNGFETQDRYLNFLERIPEIFGSYSLFQSKYQNVLQKKDWFFLSELMKKWDFNKDNLTQEEFSFLIRIRYQFPGLITIRWSDISSLEKIGDGCKVYNKTGYSNWVFAIAYLQKMRGLLSSLDTITEYQKCVFFGSYKDIDVEKYYFPLFRIRLVEDGFVFEDESVADVAYFYARCGFSTGMEDNELYAEECFRNKQEESEEGSSEDKKIGRKRCHDQADLPSPKKVKTLTRQEVHDLYDVVFRRSMLTAKNCEIFMDGSEFLSKEMIDVLSKKVVFLDIGSEDVQEKWRFFIKANQEEEGGSRYEKMISPCDFKVKASFLESLNESWFVSGLMNLGHDLEKTRGYLDFSEDDLGIDFEKDFGIWEEDFILNY